MPPPPQLDPGFRRDDVLPGFAFPTDSNWRAKPAQRDAGMFAVSDASATRMALVAVALAVALRILFASGFVDQDDRAYIERAYHLSIGDPAPRGGHQGARLGIAVPTALSFAVFGVGRWQASLFFLLCSVAGVGVAYWGGRMLFDARTGVVAAFLLAVFPLDVIYATIVSPTAPTGLFAGLAVLLFLRGESGGGLYESAAAGVALGVACVFGEIPLFAFLVYPFYALAIGGVHRRHVAVGAGFAAVLFCEAAATGWWVGDPLTRLRSLAGASTVRSVNADVAEAGWTLDWLSAPLLRACTEQELGLFFVLGLPLAAWRCVRSKSASERTLALWIVVLFLWISYGSVSPLTYAPLARLPRYLSIVQIPLVLILALWLRRLSARHAAIVAGFVFVSSVSCVLADGSRSRSYPYESLQAFVAAERPVRIVVDQQIRMPFLFSAGYAPAVPVSVLRGAPEHPVVVDAATGDRATVDSLPAGAVVVARRPAIRRWLAEQPSLRTLRQFPPRDDLYRKLLRSRVVRSILAVARSNYRMEALENQAAGADTIEAYGVR